MLVNTSSVLEYKTVTDSNNNDSIESQLESINNFIERIRQTIDDTNFDSLSLESENEIQGLFDKLFEFRISILDSQSLPTYISKILEFILGLIYSIIGTIIGVIFGKIFGPKIVLLTKLLTAPAVLLAEIIAFIVNLFNP
jgi:hypothetical protein